MPKGQKLTKKQRAFAHEYARNGGNATQAVISAGYSKNGARVMGSVLLANRNVAALVAKLTESQLEKVDASAERIKLELARLALADPSKLYDKQGRLLHIVDMPEDVRRAISGVDTAEDGTVKLRFWSKNHALETLAKHHGLLHEVLEVVEAQAVGEVSDEEWQELARLRHVVRAEKDDA